ncbi:regulatory-associated protein of mTOR isoform X2 [Plodia interpunctella]|uniref:regulatory-associated protein of mTOR isoform X2 n=1 Tax=Plodia interpunctella TaxID=58824 RepID=UPI002367529E|nr:regulatory-associated protein of mTOR isoform X2 [Plodia interpunctella]
MTDMPPYLAVKDEENSNQGDSETSSDIDDWDLPLCFNKPRHLEPIKGAERVEHSWRVKEKYKTHCVALVLCLNVGVDPPDVVKTQPCARLECWIDPNSLSPSKALESIGHSLQSQYERWQPRARYKQSLDPTSDEVKKLCCSLRRNAKDERVLFHYNGHGVPKPTAQGEIWVFNRAYTQYIPLSMYDLQTWMGAPSLYVYDCSNAGVIVDNFRQFAEQHEREYEAAQSAKPAEAAAVSYRHCIQLAACAAGQTLPMNPELPADLFTACLTTPVKMAMKWFVLRTRTRVAQHDLIDLIDKIPGQVSDRRTMLGELNWIFTAITDTIAWSSLPPPLFQQLFRADLLTASLCRNFLLADRIMRSYNCTPVSSPALPSLARHPLWAAWEQTLDLALAQLPALLPDPKLYTHSAFFRDQLTAFQVWLDLGSARRPPPSQLPMVLQVLLSTLHRLRALQQLSRFLALGAWAVRAVLAVGIFPYMLKLLQASAPDLRAAMVYIWGKIIAVDPSCQVDLVNAKGHKYFLAVLQDPTVDIKHRTLAAYVLAGIVDNYPAGQEAALQGSMISICLEQLGECSQSESETEESARLQQWVCVGVGRLWRGCEAARWAGVRDLAHEKLQPALAHARVEVRAAAAFALGCFMAGGARARSAHAHAHALDQQVAVALAARLPRDASHHVRAEILAALQWPVLTFEQHFIAVYMQERMRRSNNLVSGPCGSQPVAVGQDALQPHAATPPTPSRHPRQLQLPAIGFGSVYMKLWHTLVAMAREPHPQVSQMASDIISYISNQTDNVSREVEMPPARTLSSSSSLPPSPNTRGAVADHHATLPNMSKSRSNKASLSHAASEDSAPAADRDSTSSSSSQPKETKKPIVQTQFVEWASSQFCRAEDLGQLDCQSRSHHERVWRYSRNNKLRTEARALLRARAPRLDTQAFHSRCALPPSVVLFHPYDQHLTVASKDNFGVWDWGTAAKLLVGAWRRSWGRITALAHLNAHDHALLAVASHTGQLLIYRGSGSSAEPALVAGWRALDALPAPDYRPPRAQPIYSLAQLVSEQFAANYDERGKQDSNNAGGGAGTGANTGAETGAGAEGYSAPPPTLMRWSAARGSLALAGASALVRVWDARAELLLRDVPTGRDARVSALSRAGDMLMCGFADGCARGWDERTSAAPVLALHDHAAPVLCATLRSDVYTLITGAADGAVRFYDTRRLSVRHTAQAPAPLAALDVHPLCSLVACGSVNQCISIYDLSGSQLHSIKFHEGFMGARIGPVSCLTFHPLRCALGVGSKDSTVSVYVSEPRR